MTASMITASASPNATGPEAMKADPRRVDTASLTTRLAKAVRAWPLTLVDATGSTNADLLAHLRTAPAAAPAIRLAYTQTAGRGQRGRTWLGQPGDSLMFSLAYRMPGGPAQLAGLSLATGVAVVEALSDLPLAHPQALALKWPNDVLLSGRKLAGILIETVPAGAAHIGVVIGIGINLRRAEAMAEQISDATTAERAMTPSAAVPTQPAALDEILTEPDMTIVLAALLNRLEPMLTRFAIDGFAPFREDWETMHAFANAPIRLIERGQNLLQGIALGVDAQGRLRVATQEGERIVVSGDVSLRPAEPNDVPGGKK